MSNSPPSKRLREDTLEEDACEQLGLIQDPAFWFSDGSLVLIAGNIAFKVYHGVLAGQSSVFADMLCLPRPPSMPDMDGCPLLNLSDAPEDLRYLLQTLFPPPSIPGGQPAHLAVTFPYISALIRLSHKYQIDALLQQGINVLTSYYTNEYSRWVKRHENVFQPERIHAIDAVYLARLTETHSILPTALLLCSQLETQLPAGYTREDGTRVTLSEEDLGCCISARTRLMEKDLAGLRLLAKFLGDGESNTTGCVAPHSCRKFVHNFWSGVLTGFEGYDKANLLPWVKVVEKFASVNLAGFKLCSPCSSAVQNAKRCNEGRHGTWRTLPDVVGVEVDSWRSSG